MARVMLRGTPDPSWKKVQEIISQLDPATIPRRALQHRSEQYREQLEGLREEARELLLGSGDKFLDQAFRGGTA